MGQKVPLFACMEIAQENEKGKPVLPLFFELDDANDAVKQAVSSDGGNEKDFEVVCLNLPEAVSLLANEVEESTAFLFIPPTSSIKHIQDYLSSWEGDRKLNSHQPTSREWRKPQQVR